MPLARFQLRNEYGLGAKELYREPSEIEDPKLVLDGVAVAGLVGLLRQLGDLAEFAAEVFHGIQDELTTTASKSRKLIARVKRVEAALPPIEKAILSQTSHIHFAYAPGSDWHARIRNEQNHFIYNYLPKCIMDPYEECREPPRLQLLDKFDAGGPGSCLKRYSDPTFFRKLSANSDINDEKSHKGRKSRKSKRRRAKKRSSQLPFSAPLFDSIDRPKISLSSKPQQPSPVHTSTYDMTVKSDLVVQPDSHSSGDGMGFIDCVFHPTISQTDKTKIVLPISDNRMMSSPDNNNIDQQTSDIHDDVQQSSVLEKNTHPTSSVAWVSVLDDRVMNSPDSDYVDEQTPIVHDDVQESSTMEKNTSGVTWDEKVEIVDPMVLFSDLQDDPSLHETSSEFDKLEIVPSVWKSLDEPCFDYDEPDIEPMKLTFGSYEPSDVHSTDYQLNLENGANHHLYRRNEISEVSETDDLESIPSGQIVDFAVKNQPDEIESETENFVDALNAIETDSEKDLDYQTRTEVVPYTHLKDDLDNTDDQPLELESSSSPYQDLNQTTCEESFHLSPASFDTSQKEVSVHADDLVSPLELADKGTDFGIPDDITNSLQEQSHLSIADSVQQLSDLGFTDEITDTLQPQSDVAESLLETKETDMINAESDNVNSVALWTNGGLLGLLPSKPTDFKTSDYPGISTTNPSLDSNANLINVIPSVTHPETKDRSNGTFYANDDGGLLTNGLQKTNDKKSETVTSPVNSPPPSPPLDHMKISFQPFNAFETFKLKLKYPEGIEHHDENVNVYPSFQLIPEPNRLQSDSDDDTFCRSNPCMSDDDISYLSDSVWGSGDSLDDDRRCDGLERISYDELVLCSGEQEKMGTKSELEYKIGLSRGGFGPISDIPVLNVVNSTLYQENKFRIHHSRNEGSGTSVDENEEFLQQIRMTSFNLRKTGLLTPNCTSTPPTNVNVTAILHKASSIRKVVASDGEEIEPWSDT